MKRLLIAIALCGLPAAAFAAALLHYQPGPRLIDGSQLNEMVDVVNGLSGQSTLSTLTVQAIAGGDSSLGIAGQAANQGGAVAIVGGTSAATGNAGGAVTVVGGTPGLTGVGGAVSLTSGAGGATSGAAGAVAITAGAATSANGASITITAGAGAGGTNAGGSVNLVSGAAVSTGIPGTVQINGSAALVCATYAPSGAPAATDAVFFIATRAYMVITVSEVHSVAAGGASKLQVTKDSTTAAPGAGTDLLTNNTNAGFDLAATANTVQVGTLTATVATKTLAAGDRLAIDYADAIQSSAGVVVTACMAPL